MRTPSLLLALTASLLCTPAASALSEFGIEGMGVVSTPANEVRASISANGQRIVWASNDRAGASGGWDLWQARLKEGRWSSPQALALNTSANESDPFFSADGQWLYFSSNRAGGIGGDDLYRAAVLADGSFGPAQNLGATINTRDNERSPTLSLEGRRLMFSSNRRGGAGGYDLWTANWDGNVFIKPTPVPGVSTAQDEIDAAWLGDGRAIVLARSAQMDKAPTQLWLAQCQQGRYAEAELLPLSFNSAEGTTLGPVVDASKPGELLVTGSAKAPRAGKLDIYRMRAPTISGSNDCR